MGTTKTNNKPSNKKTLHVFGIPPTYIVEANILTASQKFPWKGEGMHTGPYTGTKWHKALEKLTVCAHTTLVALMEEWLVWRLNNFIDKERFLHHVDAVLAWTIDWRYRDHSSLKGSIPNDTPINQALGDSIWMIRLATQDELYKNPATSDNKSAALLFIIKHILPSKSEKDFVTWLDWAIDRAAKLDPKPKKKLPQRTKFKNDQEYYKAVQPWFGKPIPFEAFDPNFGYKPEQREDLLSLFLKRLDWKKNPFLRSPAQMKKLGFKGTPYKLK